MQHVDAGDQLRRALSFALSFVKQASVQVSGSDLSLAMRQFIEAVFLESS